jgi:hypothetical protein
MPNGLEMVDVPEGVNVRSHGAFYVWSAVAPLFVAKRNETGTGSTS